MADLRRRKPDDDRHADDDLNGSKADGTNSDDEQIHHKKSGSGLTTADSSDHVTIFTILLFSLRSLWFIHKFVFTLNQKTSEIMTFNCVIDGWMVFFIDHFDFYFRCAHMFVQVWWRKKEKEKKIIITWPLKRHRIKTKEFTLFFSLPMINAFSSIGYLLTKALWFSIA